MEVLNCKGAVLSNCEVYALLQDLCRQEKGRKNMMKTQADLANIAFETMKYLEKTACRNQNAEVIQGFLQAVKEFKLTKAEKLQLINLRPTTPVEMQLIIEDSEERLSEEQVEELIGLVELHLPDIDNPQTLVNGTPGK
ncbi:DNA-directed RNA polymerase III subunit RPC9-like [Penaeus monodon]|uniref:DNA-directed RNA polymerase III subunit RPC9-like n=1 Tax=Penaeus monodon TaxID=6687 RepID=UPI0018A73AA6|nr:DNA-directed RNA polymerase III subunit RPC9-like [Penaeus monodon]